MNEAEKLFLEMRPGFFGEDYVKNLPEDTVRSELTVYLPEYKKPDIKPDGIKFGFYTESPEKIRETVFRVDEGWGEYFDGSERIYCAFDGRKVVSFCLLSDFGEYLFLGKMSRFGGPGCVGTLPEYRCRGIGSRLVSDATEIFKNEGFDYGYIHDTGVADFYKKLGYTVLAEWNRNGFITK